MNQEYYIKRCIELAGKALGKTYPNPLVGSVIVHNDRIIGEGFHKKAGEPHAEINAINSVKNEDKHLIPESTIYVSLEPCAHFGKTPPCALKIVELGFKKVVIGAMGRHDKMEKVRKSLPMQELKLFPAFWKTNAENLINDFSLTTRRNDRSSF